MAKFNKSEIKWLITLIGLTYYIYNLISTGKIYYFLRPRMVIYDRILLVFLIILIIVQLIKVFTSTENRKISIAVFLIPLVLGFLINPQGLCGEIAAKKGVAVLEDNVSQSKTPTTDTNTDSIGNNIVITDSNFSKVVDDTTFNNPSTFKGKNVTVTGFVYKDKTLSTNEFLIARLEMVCCAADLQVTGLLCNFNKSSELTSDSWITVSGTMYTENHSFMGQNQLMCVIKVNKIEPATKPKIPYVYPEQ